MNEVLHIGLFAVALGIFLLFAYRAYGVVRSPHSFFYKEECRANIISLTAANITLGTGLVYLIQAGQQNGALMLFAPLAMFAGYYLMAELVTRYVSQDVMQGANFLVAVSEKIERETGSQTPFGMLVSISLISVFTLILPFEIFASSQVIVPFLAPGGGVTAQIVVSLVIFLAALIYVLMGGIQAVFSTDKLQLAAVVIFLFVLGYITVSAISGRVEADTSFPSVWKLDNTTVFNVVAACIGAFSTQFYSLLNWGYLSHMKAEDRAPMLKAVGFFSMVMLSLVISVGVFYPVESGQSSVLTGLMAQLTAGDQLMGLGWILSGLAFLGMIAIVFSTVDSLMIKVVMFFYENVAKKNSRETRDSPNELRSIRIIVSLVFLLVFLLLGYFNFAQPNLFYLLLAIVAGVSVFAPMLVTAGILSRKEGSLRVLQPFIIWSYFSLFCLASLFSAYAFLFNQAVLGWVGILSFIIALILSIWVLIRKPH